MQFPMFVKGALPAGGGAGGGWVKRTVAALPEAIERRAEKPSRQFGDRRSTSSRP